jgi:hypothetical protein
MVHESLLTGAVGASLTLAGLEQVADVRGRTSAWVYQNYQDRFSKDWIVRQQPQFAYQQRDFAVLNSAFVFDATGAERDGYLAGQRDHSLVLGWGYENSEQEFFSSASRHNLMGVPADHLQSAAAASRWQVETPPQPDRVSSAATTESDVHYVAFVMSDGDNVQWLTNDFARDSRWFGSPHRGEFDFTFDMTPALRDVNPVALKYLYDQAAADPARTYFATAGGYGLNYPSETPDIEGSLDASIAAMRAVDHHVLSVLDDAPHDPTLRAMAAREEILGVMLKTGAAYAGRRGAIDWTDGKPIVSVKYTLWDGFDTPNAIVAALNAAPRAPFSDERSYTIVNVHPWSSGTSGGGQGDPMSSVAHIVDRLGPSVRVVTLEELFVHLRNNLGAPANPSFGRNLLANGSFEAATVQAPGQPTGWFSSPPPTTAWSQEATDAPHGDRTVALLAPQADWRSAAVAVEPGETLELSLAFQLVDVPAGSGFRADARFFAADGAFLGESVQFFASEQYAAQQWHVETIAASVPVGAATGDVRFSTLFGPFAGGSVLLDDVGLVRRGLPGDFNRDQRIDAADLAPWEAGFAADARGDANADGVTDGGDLLAWQRGWGGSVAAVVAGSAMPEPVTLASGLAAWAATLQVRPLRRSRRMTGEGRSESRPAPVRNDVTTEN